MTRLRRLWVRTKSSLWFIPSVLTAAAAALAIVTVELDRRVVGPGVLDMPGFVFGAGAAGARGVLATIAGSIITVTGVVFSITIVALQLASSQFTPRVLRSFTEDRANQVVLGVFIGTFTYALLVLRTVRSALDDYDRFVPSISVTIALALALVSVGFLIFYVNHVARSIQAEVIIERVTHDALDSVRRLFPDEMGESALENDGPPEFPSAEPARALSRRGGYLQSIDQETVLRLAEREDLVVRIEREIGSFVLPDEAFASVWPASADEKIVAEMRNAFQLGAERTREQDIERGLIELSDIGIRALSPGVNDPTTAIVCIDRLSEVMSALGTRRFPDPARAGADGRFRVYAPRTTFAQTVAMGFAQMRHHGTRDPAVTIRLLDALGRVAGRVPAARRRVLGDEIRAAVASARRDIVSPPDIARVERAAERALRAAAEPAEPV